MKDLPLIVGANVDEMAQKLAGIIESLPPDKIIELESELRAEIIPFLPSELQNIDKLFGLKFTLKKEPSMAHSGWVYSKYYYASADLGSDPSILVAHYADKQFRQFSQFSIKKSVELFLGFDKNGGKILNTILEAELQFNPNDFDTDGYLK